MAPETILTFILIILAFDYALDQLLDYLNLKHLKPKLPEQLSTIYDADRYSQSIRYIRYNTRFSFLSTTFSFLLSFIVIYTGFLGTINEWLGQYFTSQTYLSLAFFGLIFIASDIIKIPFQLYDTFVIEEKFGFNKTTLRTFFTDKFKGYLLTIIIGGGILYLLVTLILEIGQNFWIYFWIAITLFTLLINIFYTSLILPLFNKLKPLEDGELKNEIEAYCKSVDFPLTNVYEIDGSKRSTKANAFFSGLGKRKKVVLYDTLIQNHTTEELVAVIAHEVGHYKKKHIVTGFGVSALQTGIILFILSRFIFSPELSIALGADKWAIHLNLIAFAILFTPISHITGILGNLLSRKNEYEADAFASKTYKGEPLKEALKKLSVKNLSNLTPHPAYVFFHYSHPKLLDRLKAIDNYTE